MTTPIPFHGHHSPAVGFEQPFEMLAACHDRVQRMLALLGRLAAHLEEQGADSQAAQAARDVMRYFDVAGPAHHEDEERHVLPWLAAHGRAALAARLHDDHLRMAEAWREVRTALDEVVQGRWPVDAAAMRVAQWRDFAALYAGHIAVEEGEAYPPVAQAVGPAALDAMGREMAARRGQ
ncbi:MAG: hemerythrin domain-containing protein [Rubrivivax sp.]|jgi:hemerythrin-like domain-containing protein|nr:hemerythrin domain-containing protein [Rubrivivax sp.]